MLTVATPLAAHGVMLLACGATNANVAQRKLVNIVCCTLNTDTDGVGLR